MHDPNSLAFSIRVGNFHIADVWHVDPCRGSSDDSCGWIYPRLTTEQHATMRDLGWWEGRERHFLRYPFKTYQADVADREALYRAAILMVARMLGIRISFDEAATMAAHRFSVGGTEGPDGLFCFVAGYHSNYPKDRREDRARVWQATCTSIARELLRKRRRWWQHPRWHVGHWKVTFPALRRTLAKIGRS